MGMRDVSANGISPNPNRGGATTGSSLPVPRGVLGKAVPLTDWGRPPIGLRRTGRGGATTGSSKFTARILLGNGVPFNECGRRPIGFHRTGKGAGLRADAVL